MSNNFQNLFIILAIAGIILYVSNMRQKHQENFSVLNKLISGIDNMSEAELEEYEKKIANDNDEEKLISDLNKASELIGEDYDMDDEKEKKGFNEVCCTCLYLLYGGWLSAKIVDGPFSNMEGNSNWQCDLQINMLVVIIKTSNLKVNEK